MPSEGMNLKHWCLVYYMRYVCLPFLSDSFLYLKCHLVVYSHFIQNISSEVLLSIITISLGFPDHVNQIIGWSIFAPFSIAVLYVCLLPLFQCLNARFSVVKHQIPQNENSIMVNEARTRLLSNNYVIAI